MHKTLLFSFFLCFLVLPIRSVTNSYCKYYLIDSSLSELGPYAFGTLASDSQFKIEENTLNSISNFTLSFWFKYSPYSSENLLERLMSIRLTSSTSSTSHISLFDVQALYSGDIGTLSFSVFGRDEVLTPSYSFDLDKWHYLSIAFSFSAQIFETFLVSESEYIQESIEDTRNTYSFSEGSVSVLTTPFYINFGLDQVTSGSSSYEKNSFSGGFGNVMIHKSYIERADIVHMLTFAIDDLYEQLELDSEYALSDLTQNTKLFTSEPFPFPEITTTEGAAFRNEDEQIPLTTPEEFTKGFYFSFWMKVVLKEESNTYYDSSQFYSIVGRYRFSSLQTFRVLSISLVREFSPSAFPYDQDDFRIVINADETTQISIPLSELRKHDSGTGLDSIIDWNHYIFHFFSFEDIGGQFFLKIYVNGEPVYISSGFSCCDTSSTDITAIGALPYGSSSSFIGNIRDFFYGTDGPFTKGINSKYILEYQNDPMDSCFENANIILGSKSETRSTEIAFSSGMCNQNFYINAANVCSTSCDSGLWANEQTRKCDVCSSICNECNGPDANNCLSCLVVDPYTLESSVISSNEDYTCDCVDGNYEKSDGSCGSCKDFGEECSLCTASGCEDCGDNTYLNGYFVCEACHYSCEECDGAGEYNCISCQTAAYLNEETSKCEYCYGVDGFVDSVDSCIEVCGDGRNYHVTNECDDGNLSDGDGCSSLCKVETNFECSGGNKNSPDICERIVGPKADVFEQGVDSNLFVIRFSAAMDEDMDLLDHSTISLQSFDGQLVNYQIFLDRKTQRIWLLFVYPKNGITLSKRHLSVVFDYLGVVDIYGLNMEETSTDHEMVFGEIPKINENATGTKNFLRKLFWVLLVFFILFYFILLFGSQLNVLWKTIESLQILALLLYINTQHPIGIRDFCYSFLGFDWSFLPNAWTIALESWVEYDIQNQNPPEFFHNWGLTALFFSNCGHFITWGIIYLIFHVFIRVLETAFSCFGRIQTLFLLFLQFLEWGFPLRCIYEIIIPFTFYVLIQWTSLTFYDIVTGASCFLSLLFGAIIAFLILIIFNIINNKRYDMRDPYTREDYSPFSDKLNPEMKWNRNYHLLVFCEYICLTSIIVAFYNFPYGQMIILMFIFFSMAIFVIVLRPYNSIFLTIRDFLVQLLFGVLMIFMMSAHSLDGGDSNERRVKIGWVSFAIAFIILLINLAAIFVGLFLAIKMIFRRIRKLVKKSKKEGGLGKQLDKAKNTITVRKELRKTRLFKLMRHQIRVNMLQEEEIASGKVKENRGIVVVDFDLIGFIMDEAKKARIVAEGGDIQTENPDMNLTDNKPLISTRRNLNDVSHGSESPDKHNILMEMSRRDDDFPMHNDHPINMSKGSHGSHSHSSSSSSSSHSHNHNKHFERSREAGMAREDSNDGGHVDAPLGVESLIIEAKSRNSSKHHESSSSSVSDHRHKSSDSSKAHSHNSKSSKSGEFQGLLVEEEDHQRPAEREMQQNPASSGGGMAGDDEEEDGRRKRRK